MSISYGDVKSAAANDDSSEPLRRRNTACPMCNPQLVGEPVQSREFVPHRLLGRAYAHLVRVRDGARSSRDITLSPMELAAICDTVTAIRLYMSHPYHD